jgi:hypothetical protein
LLKRRLTSFNLFLDEAVITENLPEKLEVFRSEKDETSHFTEPAAEAAQQFTTADK